MRRPLVFGGALLVLLSFVDCVAAQQTTSPALRDRPVPPPPPPTWSGPQFGIFGGGSIMPMSFVEPGAILCPPGLTPQPRADCFETPFGFSGRPVSPTFGVLAGYDRQYGTMVAGVEVDAAWKRGSISGSLTALTTLGGLAPPSGYGGLTRTEGFAGRMTQGWDGSIRLRYGVLVDPLTLAYVTAGGAVGHLCGSFGYTASIPAAGGGLPAIDANGAGSWCDARLGYTAGGGVEMQLSRGETRIWADPKIRFEYRYTDFGSFSKDVALAATPCGGTVTVCTGTAHIDLRAAFHTLRVGLDFHFGDPPPRRPLITK